MSQSLPRVALLGLLIPLGAALTFMLTSSKAPKSSEVPEKERSYDERTSIPSAAVARQEEETRASESPGQPKPVESKGESRSVPEWVRPTSPEEYWQELERLEREDKAVALSYALAGQEWYPDEGRPAEARHAKIVTLLVDTGKMEEARTRTRSFIEKYPSSPYRPLVQGVTGIHPRPGAPPWVKKTAAPSP